MLNQSNYDKVNSKMIAPLNVFFSTRLPDEMVDAFVEDLSEYSAETLGKSFKQLRRSCKRMPTLAQVIEVCKEMRSDNYQNNGLSQKVSEEIETNNEKCSAMVDRYIADYKTRAIWLQASREGWQMELWRYVNAVATIQAQMICKQTVGWNKADIFGINYQLSDEEIHHFFESQKAQAEAGFISVSDPASRIEEWRKHLTKFSVEKS